nr:WG repeat-containing protein [Bacteroidota bacterium]
MKTKLSNILKCLLTLLFLIPILSFSQDYKWEWVIEPQFDAGWNFSEGLAPVGKGKDYKTRKWGYIDKTGKLVIDYQFDDASSFSEGRAEVVNKELKDKYYYSGKIGFINKTGTLCIGYKYCENYVSEFSEGLAAVEIKDGWNSKCGYIDKNGNTVLDFIYKKVGKFSEGLAPVKFYSDNEQNLSPKKVYYINKKGEIVLTTKYESGSSFSEGIAFVRESVIKDGKFLYSIIGAIDKYGNELFEPKYQFASAYQDGYARINSNGGLRGKYGFIDKKGNIVIDTIYDGATNFFNGLALVWLDGVKIIIDKSGEEVNATYLGSISDGLSLNSDGKDGKYGYQRLLNEYEQVFRYVNLELDKWDDKGKYEKLGDYQNRVNENTRKIKIKELQEEALGVIGSELFERKCQNKSFDYDPESEIFKIDMEAVPAIFVRVPIDEALSFDENFEKIEYNSFSWGLDEKQILITKATLFNPVNSKSYTYDINTPITFKKVEVLANFNPIDIEDISTIDKADQKVTKETVEFGLSDVDVDIPKSTIVKDKTYCLIIGNEDYTKYQPNLNTESNVDFAINDARIFSEYCNKTLGVPKENITLLEDAISSQMKREIMRLANKTKYSKGDVELIFYYSGHGFPDNETKEGFIMPVDIAGANVSDGIKLSKLYQDLTEYPSKKGHFSKPLKSS